MKAQYNKRFGRFVSIALVAFSVLFLFKYLYDLEQQNTLRKEEEAALKLMEEQEAANQKYLLELENQKKEEERLLQLQYEEEQRRQLILENRAVVEPKLDLKNISYDLLERYYFAIPQHGAPWTDETLKFLKSPLGQQALSDLFTVPESMPSFKELTFQHRIFKSLFEYFDPLIAEGKTDFATDPDYQDSWDLYIKLQDRIFPWIKPNWYSVFDINKKTAGRGIVMCVGNGQFKYAVGTIKSIRDVLKSDMPIQVFYIDESDLSEEKRKYLQTIPNLTTHQLIDSINNKYTQFGGWDIKPYAMLASTFSEVILMDADVYLFKKPETFFEDEGYQETGALFFLDRTLFDNYEEGRRWLKSFLPTYSNYVEQSRWWKTTSAHEQESGIVVMNKKKVLLGLLSTCKMNDKDERDKVSYEHIHGDKETFWIGFEMMQTPYVFVKSHGAVIGGLGDAGGAGTVCGNQLHLDTRDGRPWWWNGGLLRNKNRWDDRYMKFTHFAEGEDWQFETSCIKEKDKIQELNTREREIGEKTVALDKAIKRKHSDDTLFSE